jgi:hypothetical protein
MDSESSRQWQRDDHDNLSFEQVSHSQYSQSYLSTTSTSHHGLDLADKLNASSHDWNTVNCPPGSARKRFASHDFPGYGSYDVRAAPMKKDIEVIQSKMDDEKEEKESEFLQELEATAISGNDILSSTFYVSGLVTLSAGKMAPVCLACVGFVLYLFRGIYHETVMALPVNGGTYNILLNCTSKQIASMAAVFAIIAYITTGVVSAVDAIAYLQTSLPPGWEVDQKSATIGLLFFFCLLTNLGIKESAFFAKVIFVVHVLTLTLLATFGTIHMIYNPGLLYENFNTPYPSVPSHGSLGGSDILYTEGGILTAIFYGFSSAMLGVSGFETSSQFVEEQAPGVFPKTLRNMWAGVMIFNPLLSLISFSALQMSEIMDNTETVLARTAHVVGHWIQVQFSFPDHYKLGPTFSTLISLDAFIVLAAALLTSFIGINGLIRRMSMDRCLPQFLLIQNPYTGTDSFILVGFFLLCVSQVLLFDSNIAALGGVYCYAFLAVMTIFAIGNMLLKVKRPSLPREISVSWLHAMLGFISVLIAFMGNILGKPQLLTYFFVYVFVVGSLVFAMFQRVRIVRLVYKLLKRQRKALKMKTEKRMLDNSRDDDASIVSQSTYNTAGDEDTIDDTIDEEAMPLIERKKLSCLSSLSKTLKKFQDVPFVFFCKHDDVHLLNKAILYIQSNEQTNKIIIVHCANSTDTALLAEHVKLMDLLYPKTKISLLILDSPFSPAAIEWVSQALKVPVNAMFISCPDENFAMKVNQLRGMRIITSYD